MADFQQRGSITTLHRLKQQESGLRDRELYRFAHTRPMGLVLPALITEFERPAMRLICDQLRAVPYFQRIVVAIGRATRAQVLDAMDFFRGFASPVTVLWVEDPRLQRICRTLEQQGVPAGCDGKGRTCWLSFGYLLARGDCDAVGLHDCDIASYSRDMVARLCYPMMHPELDFDYAKGYYARTSDRLHGRVTRLFVGPMLQALRAVRPDSDFVPFVEDFRYPLAGEFAVRSSLLDEVPIAADWGLEVGLLWEVFRRCRASRVCQIDISDNYDHKHQELCADDPSRGLRRMSRDIATSLLKSVSGERARFTPAELERLGALYSEAALGMIDRYAADAVMNGLFFDRQAEREAICVFRQSMGDAGVAHLANHRPPVLPSWKQVRRAVPGLAHELLQCEMERPRIHAMPPLAVVPHAEVHLADLHHASVAAYS